MVNIKYISLLKQCKKERSKQNILDYKPVHIVINMIKNKIEDTNNYKHIYPKSLMTFVTFN